MGILIFIIVVTNLAILAFVTTVFLKLNKQKPAASAPEQLSKVEASLKQVETLEDQFKRSLEEAISKNNNLAQNTSNSLIKYYQDTVTTMTLNYNQNSAKLMDLLDTQLKAEIKNLKDNSIDQVQKSRDEIDKQIKEELVEVEKAVQQYKVEQLKKVDEAIYQIIAETAKNSVGKVINLLDHQEMVMGALEQAKKDKFFS